VKIIDSKIFSVTPISAAIVTLKPGGLRELHWHPNADEWQYYISGKGRMTVFAARSGNVDARQHPQAGSGYYPAIKLGGTISQFWGSDTEYICLHLHVAMFARP
jgi:oxalate decarboxylase/phosphoglucose isomerase-like protein (cupin superfamily)